MVGFRSGVKSKTIDNKGYTIIEVMIVLAVSGGLLVAVMGTISGQQQRTQFVTGVRDFETKIQDIVNDVQTGYYPNTGETSCYVDGGNNLQVNGPAKEQGTNEDCIFLGKGLEFYSANVSSSSMINYRSMTIAGKRQAADGEDVTSLTDATPKSFSGNNATGNGVDTWELPNGVELTEIKYFATGMSGATEVESSRALGVLTTITSVTSSLGGNVDSASGRPRLASLNIDSNDPDGSQLSSAISGLNNSSYDMLSTGAVFCLRDGSRGRPAAVTLGVRLTGNPAQPFQGTGQQLSSQTYFDEQADQFGCPR